jgi:hypothetical protein
MSYGSFVSGLRGKRTSGGGGGQDFLDLDKGENWLRLFLFKDARGIEEPGLNYFQHWVEKKPYVCIPNTYGTDDECEICAQSALCYAEDDRDRGWDIAAKPNTWVVVVPLPIEKGEDPEPQVLNLTGATAQKIFTSIAVIGGWTGEADFENEEFGDCIRDGIPKCFGRKARDLCIKYDPKSKNKKKVYMPHFSRTLGRVVNVDAEDIPDLVPLFRRVKRLDQDEEEKPRKTQRRAPPKGGKKKAAKKTSKKVAKKAAKKRRS